LGSVWVRQATLSAQAVEQAVPGVPFDVPVSLQVSPGSQVAGLEFRAVLDPNGPAPAVATPLEFIPDPNLPAPPQNLVPNPNTALCGWPLVPSASFDPPLQGSNILGRVRVTLPSTAQAGQSYTLRFANADGSPDLQTQYNFDTRSASLWVLSPALTPPSMTSDEWKLHFFGSLDNPAAADNADPDQDGVPNWAEYLAGTDPTDSRSFLHLAGSYFDVTRQAVVLRWLSAPGKVYQIQAASSLSNPAWTSVASGLLGDGTQQQWIQTQLASKTQFYRIGLQP
jgi:hypothetical protein